MNILMMTNTYLPLVGGLERSVAQFAAHYRKRGHRVLIVAPALANQPAREKDVIRIPAIRRFHGTEMSLQLPVPGVLSRALKGIEPDVVHAHHPFLVGGTALRLAYARNLPLVFTHHTLFEYYTHFLPVNSPAVKRFVMQLATGYANLCDQVFAPSASVKKLLEERGVEAPIDVVPTGIELDRYARGSGSRFRKQWRIPSDALVIGHIGRLGPEKNLDFLVRAVALFLRRNKGAYFLLAGSGPSKRDLLDAFRRWQVSERVRDADVLRDQKLVDAYHAMDLFAFSSKSETQGLVLMEAMAAGIPVAALRASGVVDVVKNRQNGYLLEHESVEEFAGALTHFARLPAAARQELGRRAQATAAEFSMDRCADRALELYGQLNRRQRIRKPLTDRVWARALRWTRGEWRLVRNVTGAALAAVETEHASPP